MRICARCDKPIRDGETYEVRHIEAASGPGGTVFLHAWCKRIAAAQPRRHPNH
ncbi:hypothetical protein [Streptomyces chiangmaiensis]|uniref:HNH endonuclease n=1 Tax=Streptomyces chiangmaiensis TaxID=766497 RepID=A0ABU7FRS2_9ACTN|nr:hypothetical protein [Streptomyces chiangmaiensis]MED7826800.1 hypothetical protein [Streptomyces chiangmaiensis]